MSLTDRQIRNTNASIGRVVKLSDGEGLQLWLQPSGAKLWNMAYRFDGKQRKLALGPYPRISLKDARTRRDEAKMLLAEGLDPSRQKRLAKLTAIAQNANTFATIADELLAQKRREGKAPATINKLEWLFGLAKPALGALPITAVQAPEVLQVLRGVEARDRLETARRLRSIIGSVFRFAIATGRASNDPTGALRGALVAPTVRHRAAIVEPTALGELLRAIDGHSGMPEVRGGLQLLALTFVRPGELRGAQWVEVDLDKAVWTIPGERMKMRRPHRIPLARQTIAAFKNLRAITGEAELILPGARGRGRPLSENTLNAALRRLGYTKDEMTSHGFRAAASSILNESGLWNPDAIEAQLAHVEGNAIRRAYARAEFWDERVKMMQWWANGLDEIKASRKVIPIAVTLNLSDQTLGR
ncbi:tyrosine-type recombinase/integrase [Roseiarcus sp.]|uniref:tyrosine-type recombinase/integrase n=1 Tax=Roseiarcus sp. TaxID=1969460 RepID=UPI003C3F8C61